MNRKELFTNKIREVYKLDPEGALANAERILGKLPDRLLPNIDEWSRGLPLSDIYISKYSVPMILAMWKNNDFISAVEVMIEMERNPDKAVRQIWNMRR